MVNSGPCVVHMARHRGERHHVAGVVQHIKLAKVLGLGAIVALGLHVDLPLAPKAVEVIDERAAHETLHGLVDILQLHALLEHLVAIHIHIDLRNGRQSRGEHARPIPGVCAPPA